MHYAVLSKYRSELMGCAMLWVMLFHAGDLDLGLPVLNWIRSAGFGGVDIFILLSAMGLAVSLGRREQAYGAFMARRAGRIMPAYLTVMLPYTGWKVSQGAAFLSTLFWNASLLYYWVRPMGAFNWYVAGIMLFYALTPACFRFLRDRKRRELWTAAEIVLALALCQLLMYDNFWNHTDVFYRFPVFFLGLLLGLYVQEDRPLRGRDLLFWSGLFAAGMGYLLLSLRDTEGFPHFPLCHLFVFTTVPMCLAGCFLFEKLPLGLLRRFLRLLGENSLEIYLLNASVFTEKALLHELLPFGPTNRLFYLVLFSVNIVLGVGLHSTIRAVRRKICPRENASSQ